MMAARAGHVDVVMKLAEMGVDVASDLAAAANVSAFIFHGALIRADALLLTQFQHRHTHARTFNSCFVDAQPSTRARKLLIYNV